MKLDKKNNQESKGKKGKPSILVIREGREINTSSH